MRMRERTRVRCFAARVVHFPEPTRDVGNSYSVSPAWPQIEIFWDEAGEEWMLRDAVLAKDGTNRICHSGCAAEPESLEVR